MEIFFKGRETTIAIALHLVTGEHVIVHNLSALIRKFEYFGER